MKGADGEEIHLFDRVAHFSDVSHSPVITIGVVMTIDYARREIGIRRESIDGRPPTGVWAMKLKGCAPHRCIKTSNQEGTT